MNRLIAFIRRNQGPLLTLLFVAGFVGDLIAFTILDLSAVNLLFLGYLVVAAALTSLSHALGRPADVRSDRVGMVAALAPLGASFAIGGLLSGCLIFYTKSAVLSVSWPFLLLLVLIFLGNEFLRTYRSHLAFQTVLFFFALYAYLIFALPLYVNRLGPGVFLESTALASVIFALYLFFLRFVGRRSLKGLSRNIALGSVGVVATVMTLYFSGLVPPIPLTAKESGIYHRIVRTGDGYEVTHEGWSRWSRFLTREVHHVPGTPLYAYSAVFAPAAFSANIAHRWERYDEAAKRWVTESMIAFTLSGGRAGGYRGYSEKSDPRPGRWRVTIETLEGQVIGRLNFTVESVSAPPVLYTDMR